MGVRVKLAIGPKATDRTIPLVALAALVELRGFTGLFLCEHTHIPVTSVALVAEHDPIVLAKQVATLDAMSGGRLVRGVG